MKTLQAELAAFRDARDWRQYHTAEALARAIAVEAGELNTLFLWGAAPPLSRLADEVADVMIFALNLCNVEGFDAEAIIREKISKNADRPVLQDGRLGA